MTDAPRYATLRDYIRVLRGNRLLILVAMILFGAGAWLLTAGQKPLYSAQSTLSFQDVGLQTANLLGSQVIPSGETTARLQIEATDLTRPAILAAVAQELGVPSSTPALVAGVSAGVTSSNGFLVVQVESHDPSYAQRLANAYANAVNTIETQYARAQYAAAAVKLAAFAKQPKIANNSVLSTQFAGRVTQLDYFAQTANPVQVVTAASVPTTPVSPHPVRDTLLGVLLGLTIGVLIAFARDALDRRLRGSEEITETFGWPVLGHIREDVLGRAGFVSTNGRAKLSEEQLEGFRILRQNIQFLNFDQPPRSLVVTSALAAEGKSTVAASLACASALAGRRTLLIDCDLRRPTLAQKLDVENEPGLTDYLLGDASPTEVLRTIPLGTTAANGAAPDEGSAPAHVLGSQLVVIPAGRHTPYPAELLSSQRLHNFLKEVCSVYDLVVLDTSPLLPVADALELLSVSEGALLCVRASRTTSSELRAVKQAIERLPQRPTGVVLTGIRSGSETDFGYYSTNHA